MIFATMVEQKRVRWGRALGIVLALVVGCLTFSTLYISAERTFYFWDFANYADQTTRLVMLWQISPTQALQSIVQSLDSDYNQLPCILPMLAILGLGDRRTVFIGSLVVFYLLPFSLAIGALAARLLPATKTAFYTGVGLTLFTPAVWIPTLRGYPDVGGAALLIGAALCYLGSHRSVWPLTRLWRIFPTGICLGLAVLFRRPFTYGAIALLLAMALHMLVLAGIQPAESHRQRIRIATFGLMRVVLVAFCSFLTLAILASDFVKLALTTDYRALYSGYEEPLVTILLSFWGAAGGIILLLSLAGALSYFAEWRLAQHPQGQPPWSAAAFIGCWFVMIGLLWLTIVRYTAGEQYALQFIFGVILGLVALFVRRSQHSPRWPLALLVVIVTINAGLGLTPLGLPIWPGRHLWAMAQPPLIRSDYDQVVQLIQTLRELSAQQSTVYVAASSSLLNSDLVIQAERQLYGWGYRRIDVLPSPDIDSRDYYPLHSLLQAEYLVVVRPPQFQRQPSQQRVVQVVIDALQPNHPFRQSFQPLPQQFPLAQGAIVTIYRRQQDIPINVVLATLEEMRRTIGLVPGNEPFWLSLSQVYPTSIQRQRDGSVIAIAYPGYRDKSPVSSLLYYGPMPSQQAVVGGQIQQLDRRCMGLGLRLVALDAQGQEIRRSGKITGNFSLTIGTQNAAYLRLDLLNGDSDDRQVGIDVCPIRIDRLQVTTTQ